MGLFDVNIAYGGVQRVQFFSVHLSHSGTTVAFPDCDRYYKKEKTNVLEDQKGKIGKCNQSTTAKVLQLLYYDYKDKEVLSTLTKFLKSLDRSFFKILSWCS